MDSIKPAERFVLDTLRATELKKMRDDDWSGLERRVAQVGLKNVDGWYGDQLRKAIRTLVAKHGGHGDQSVHGGGKKGGSAPAPSEAPSGGGGGGLGSDDREALAEADRLIGKHESAINRSNLPQATKTEALQHLSQAKSASAKMKSAKSKDEILDLHTEAINAGENYKGTVRQAGEKRRESHYQTARRQGRFPKPYNDRELLGGLNDSDIQDIFDTFALD